MEKQDLQINESFSFETDGNKYLEVRFSDGEIEISAPNLSAVRLSSGEVYDVSGVDKLKVRNVSGASNYVSLQTFNRLKVGNLATDVSVVNKLIIQRIEEAIQVEASATVDNGTVHVVPAGSLIDVLDITINPNSSKDVLVANAARKSALLQIISATKTPVRIGGPAVAAGRGIYASGSIANPAIIPISVNGVVRVHNESADIATISVTELIT